MKFGIPASWLARLSRRVLVGLLLAGSILLAAHSSARAQGLFNATPDDNPAILASLLSVGALYNAAVTADVLNPLISPDAGLATFAASWSLQNALRLIPPYFEPPASKRVHTWFDGDNDHCTYTYDLPSNSATYANYLGIVNVGLDDEEWGLFDAPFVQHWDSTVAITLSGLAPGEGQQLSEGRYTLDWKAATQYSFLFDALVPPAVYFIFNKITKNVSDPGKVASAAFVEVASRAIDFGVNEAQDYLAEVEANPMIYNPWQLVSTDSATNRAIRTLTVWDNHPPYFEDPETGVRIRNQTIEVEARDYGGTRWNRVKDDLRAAFEAVDDCDRALFTLPVNPPSLLPIGAHGTDVLWRTSDGGPYRIGASTPTFVMAPNHHIDGEDVYATLEQRIVVTDTQAPILVAPAGFAVESSTSIATSSISLGEVQVSDLADPFPVVAHNAPPSLPVDQRVFIEYSATDASGNTTLAPAEDPYRYTQTVSVKTPGTNTAPSAEALAAATLTSAPVEVTLRGSDSDCLPVANAAVPNDPQCAQGIVDPLKFEILTPPGNGTFEAPLLPFFIEDLRLTPQEPITGDVCPSGDPRAEWQCLSCPSNLHDAADFEGKLARLDKVDHVLYVEKCYCPQSGDQTAPPRDFIYQPLYVHVTDEDTYYITDFAFECDASLGPNNAPKPRISLWDDGNRLGDRPISLAGGDFDGVFEIDRRGDIWWFEPGGTSSSAVLRMLDADLQPFEGSPTNHFASYRDDSPVNAQLGFDDRLDQSSLVQATVDTTHDIIYVNDKGGIFAFDRNAPSRYLGQVIGPDYDKDSFSNSGYNTDDRILTDSCSVVGSSKDGFSMQVDSNGNLYVSDTCLNRIFKIGPPTIDASGNPVPGSILGWMGKCTANKLDPQGIPYNACDVDAQVSRGYQCSDQKCERAGNQNDTAGTAPGQFDVPLHLNLDPNDFLYVADYRNRRVQRFHTDGTFAGQAVSTGSGVSASGSFVLGNMGNPRHVSVNSTQFFVLETPSTTTVSDYFLHVFASLPFFDVTPSSAKVKYVSEFDFQGSDEFSYRVDDGIEPSAPAAVQISVSRAFRPPRELRASCFSSDSFATDAQTSCVVDEDGTLYIELLADDPDGFISAGGLDSLSFDITQEPQHGTLTAGASFDNRARYSYQPAADFNGSDSLEFQVSDGTAQAGAPGTLALTVDPVYDPPFVKPARELHGAQRIPGIYGRAIRRCRCRSGQRFRPQRNPLR